MPRDWQGYYHGVDLSPDFIKMALPRVRKTPPARSFECIDLLKLDTAVAPNTFDWAILVSIRPMVLRNLGEDVWQQMESQVRRVAAKILYLEYDENDPGKVE
jgi:hypothetical protein